jgi:tRNA (guanine37-N1)-methyltransferase
VKFTVVTILPELIEPSLGAGVVGRAREAGVIEVATQNPRDFTKDKHRTVDDTPYGGGPGMVMKPEPLLAAIAAAGQGHRVLLSPAGKPLTQARVKELAQLPHVVLVCGRYEGIDERAIELGIDEEISLGDYVLSGGELGALVVIDACARLVPGVLGEPTSADDESHSAGQLEYPQYTRPAELEGRAVPPVLVSGNHALIAAWRREQSRVRTAARRPDLFRRLGDRALPARTHVALVHYPVRDRLGEIVTTALTNFDIHDLARSALTYGLAGYHIVTPITSQREKAEHIARAWSEAEHGDYRARALALVRTQPSIEDTIRAVTEEHRSAPRVVATSASSASFPGIPHLGFDALIAEAAPDPAPLLLLLGTGWGLDDAQIPSVSRVLAPIEGPSSWNHLSVRSAAAIILDRLFGWPT